MAHAVSSSLLAGDTPTLPARSRRSTRPAPWLLVAGGLVAVAFTLPGAYVVGRTLSLGADIGDTLSQAWAPLWRTVQLATLVSISAVLVGGGLAWLVVRTDIPGRRVLRVLAPLPLALPSFVGAAAFIAAVAPSGMLAEPLSWLGVDGPVRLRGMFPAWLVLTVFTYPYVYLPVGSTLVGLDGRLEESARLLGKSERAVLRDVVVPQLRRPALAGGLLVFLYAVSDFGAVQLLGFDTLTRVIFATVLADQATSFMAGLLLLVFAVFVVGGERRLRGGNRSTRSTGRGTTRVELGRWRWPIAVGAWSVIALGLVVPVLSLGQWAWRGIRRDNVDSITNLIEPALNGTLVAVGAAAIAVAAVLPIAILNVRHRHRLAKAFGVAVLAGYAVPGLVVALALVRWALSAPGGDLLYQTFPLLLFAYVVHFGSQAMGSSESAVAGVPRAVSEQARLLGAGRYVRWLKVELPMMAPGLLAGAGLVMLSTLKELPATLILAPIGFDTLATDVWGAYSEGFYGQVGVSSLALVAVSAALTWFLILRRAGWITGR